MNASRSHSGEGATWQFYQVWVQFVPNQKGRGFHLCFECFLSLISSLWNWKWQGNYHFILNWSQSMWAGSRSTDKRGEREMEEREEGGKKGFWEHLAMVQSSLRCIAWRVGRDGGGGEGRGGETFWRLHCGCSLDVPLTGTRLGDARRRRFGFFICLAPPGFSWPAQARFRDSVARWWSQPVAQVRITNARAKKKIIGLLK